MEPRQKIYTLDLDFQGRPAVIAAYLIPHSQGAVLIESGPGSTLPALDRELARLGFSVGDISDVLITHIHLDHAGAAGWLARQGARIHVHALGAPHLLQPEKLLASAGRVYGERMQSLWGEFLPVPADRLSILNDGDVLEVGGLVLRAYDAPGHANHHLVYIYDQVCFAGDVGGVRLPGYPSLRLPTPPPEFLLEAWYATLQRLQRLELTHIALTHFGVYADAPRHLVEIGHELDELKTWMEATLPACATAEAIEAAYMNWEDERSRAENINLEEIPRFQAATPARMSAQGVRRYWQKVRLNPA